MATPCRFDVEQYLIPRQKQWRKNREPLLRTLMTINEVHHVLFGMAFVSRSNNLYDTYVNGNWTCNHNTPGIVPKEDGHKWVLVVQCKTQNLTSVSVQPSGQRKPGNHEGPWEPKTVVYDTLPLFQCEQDIQVNERPSVGSKFGLCTMVKGERFRHDILQWVEYHHMIGSNHFWIFINEQLSVEQWKALPRRPYIVYAPFNYRLGDDYASGTQQAAQNECLYRSRAYGLDWFGIHDVDEYFDVIMSLHDGVKSDLDRLVESIPNKTAIGGLRFKMCYYGREPGINSSDILLDYSGHAPVMEIAYKNSFLTSNVDYVSVHEITTGKPPYILDAEIQGYNRHYKVPHNGVRGIDQSLVEINATLRDAYAAKVKRAIKKGNKKWNLP